MSSCTALCAQSHCHAGTGLGLLVLVKENLNAIIYRDILNNCMLSTLWQLFREEPHGYRITVDVKVHFIIIDCSVSRLKDIVFFVYWRKVN